MYNRSNEYSNCFFFFSLIYSANSVEDNAPINGLPQDGGGGEFGIVKFPLGRDFDIKNGLLG